MRIIKTKRAKTQVIFLHTKEEARAWKWATAVFAVAALLALLAGCASAPVPADVAQLQAENERLRQALEECELDASQCMGLLIECEGLLK